MTKKLITVQKAKEELKRLQNYIELVENYHADTIEKAIIKEYAYTNSLTEVVKRVNNNGLHQGEPIVKNYVTAVINGKPMDELHKLMGQGYRERIKSNKKKQPVRPLFHTNEMF